MRRVSFLLLLIPALTLGVPMLAQAQVFQWKDAQGTVHFSDTPPAHGVHYKSVQVDANPANDPANASQASDNSENGSQDPNASTQPSARKPDTPRNRKDLCTSLSANIKVLQNPAPVITSGSNGKPEVMTAEQRSSELGREQAQFQQYCGA